MFIRVGDEQNDHIFFELQQEYSPSSVDKVKCRFSIIKFMIGKFQGTIETIIGIDDLRKLLRNCELLYQKLEGKAFFCDAVNEIFEFKLQGDKLGHIQISGKISDKPGSENTLSFSFSIDQRKLRVAIDDISKAIET